MPVEHLTSLASFQEAINSGQKLVVVDFHATWCGPCHAIAPIYDRLSNTHAAVARFLKIDVDAAPEISRFCSVSAMPTFHFYLRGRRVSSFSGADPQRLEQEIIRLAPSSSDVSFAGAGNRLGADSGAVTDVPSSARETAAAAAAKRMHVQAQAQAHAQAQAEPKVQAENKEEEQPRDEASADDGKLANIDEKADEMTEDQPKAQPEATASGSQPTNDTRLKVNETYLNQMVSEMGFPHIRAEKALILTGNKGLEDAVEWCFQHADDPDVDEPLQIVTSEGASKPKLSPEEAKRKAEELYARARAKREEEEKKEEREREKNRLRSGKEITAAKVKLEEENRRRAVEEKKREKREALLERQRVRQMLEADKARRREKFNMQGGASVQAPAPASVTPPAPSSQAPRAASAAGGKIQFRFPDGSRLEGEFEADQPMGDLVAFLVEKRPELSSHALQLSQQYPRKTYSPSDYTLSLGELKLLPRAALTVSFT